LERSEVLLSKIIPLTIVEVIVPLIGSTAGYWELEYYLEVQK
jgi:hypothetical protein